MNPTPPVGELVLLAYHWQTLITGVFAAIAAFATVAAIRVQIETENMRMRDERARRAASHRAILPMVLSNVCDRLRQDNHLIQTSIAQGLADPVYRFPAGRIRLLEQMDIETIRSPIEFEKEGNENIHTLSMFLAKAQIYESRRTSQSPGSITIKHTLTGLAVDCIELFSIAQSLFEYSRPDGINGVAVDESQMSMGATNLGYYDADPYFGVREHIQTRLDAQRARP
jgi:hypothetical protein